MQCCGSGMFIPDPGSWFLSIPDPGSQFSNPKCWIPDLGSQISDPGVQLAQVVVRRLAVRQARVQFSAGHTGFSEWWRMNKCMIVLCEWMLKTINIKRSGIMATIKKKLFLTLIVTNITQFITIFFMNKWRKNVGQFSKNYRTVTKLSKIWVWDPGTGSEIRDPEITYSGS